MRHLRYLSLLLIFIACQEETVEKAFVHGPFEELPGLASPIQLMSDETTVILSDYFMHPEQIDSISFPNGISGSWSQKISTTVLKGNINQAYANIKCFIQGYSYDLLLKRSEELTYTFSFDSKGQEIASIQIKGSFNAWNVNANTFEENDGVYTTSFKVFPGSYEYVLVINGEEQLDANNPEKVSNGLGGFNSLMQIGEEQAPVRLQPQSFSQDQIIFDVEEGSTVLVYWQNVLLPQESITYFGRTASFKMPNIQANERTYLRAYAFKGERSSNDVLIPLEGGKVLTETAKLTRKDWEKSIFYFMMVDRFFNGNPSNDKKVENPEIMPQANYFGGDVEGVRQKIEEGYFEAIGVNTIWLSPIVKNPEGAWGLWDKGGVRSKFSGYHGYWPVSNVLPDHRMATKQEVKDLLNLAHSKNMNVVLDYVANHVHKEHPIYKEHPDWATNLYLEDGSLNTERWDDQRLTTWFDTFMPTLDLRRKEVVDPMTDSAMIWLTEYDFDGIRHDATKHIDELYWRVLMRKIKSKVMIPGNKRIYQIGETYGSPELIKSYVGSGMMDAQFDFNLYDRSVSVFAKTEDLNGLKDELESSLTTYGFHHLMGNISGNQDRSRFITLADGKLDFAEDQKLAGWTRTFGKPEQRSSYAKLAMLHAFNFAIPGIPVIYYGDEYGMPGANDPDNRRQMNFNLEDGNEKALRRTVKMLTQLRSSRMPLLYGTTEVEVLDNGVMKITRRYFEDEVVVLINNSTEEEEIEIPEGMTGHFGAAIKDGVLQLKAYSFEYLTKK